MDIIERYPRTIVGSEVTPLEAAPHTVAARHAAHVTLAPCRMVLGIGVGTGLQFADKVFHALLAFCAARRGIDGHRRQVVTAHVTVQSVPVAIALALWRQSRLLQVGRQQPVAVVLQQRLDVQVAGLLQRSVQQGYIAEGKLVGIQLVLCVSGRHPSRQQHHCHDSLHSSWFIIVQRYEIK